MTFHQTGVGFECHVLTYVGSRCGEAACIGSRIGDESLLRLVVRGEVVVGKGHLYFLAFAGVELSCLGEGLQFDSGFLQLAFRSGDIQLYGLFTFGITRVLDND